MEVLLALISPPGELETLAHSAIVVEHALEVLARSKEGYGDVTLDVVHLVTFRTPLPIYLVHQLIPHHRIPPPPTIISAHHHCQ